MSFEFFDFANRASSGKRLTEKSFIPEKKASIISEDLRKNLKDQWNFSGRDASRVFVRLTESDDNLIYLTGWDGQDTYVGYTNDGFGYINSDRIESAKLDQDWNTEMTLGNIRNLEEMDKHQVQSLVEKFRKDIIRREKRRRFSEAKNFMRKYSQQMSDEVNEAKEPKKEKKKEYNWHTPGNYMGKPKMKLESDNVDPEVKALSKDHGRKHFKFRGKKY